MFAKLTAKPLALGENRGFAGSFLTTRERAKSAPMFHFGRYVKLFPACFDVRKGEKTYNRDG